MRQSYISPSRAATRMLAMFGAGAVLYFSARFLLNFFGPAIAYSMRTDIDYALDSEEFLRFLSLVTDGTIRNTKLTRLKNGGDFYPAELSAIRSARHTINLEFYQFSPGEIGDAMLDALAQQARAGVEVRMIVDALGSFHTPRHWFAPLLAAGGRMHFYHPVNWNTWQHVNNRTHRKLMIVDGQLGFMGGAGVADHWMKPTHSWKRQAKYSITRHSLRTNPCHRVQRALSFPAPRMGAVHMYAFCSRL